jgi:phosphonate metabolism-associated iron-containing alcohol dehydrogenase
MPTRLIAGAGSLEQLGREVFRICRSCVVVAGRRSARLSGLLERIQANLQAARVEAVLFDQVEPNPTLETIQEGANFARANRARCVIGVGGGSALDAAKAIGLLAVNQGDLRDFLKGMRPTQPVLPLVAVPTTAGTGSEVTPYAVLTDVSAGDKYGLVMPELFPRIAILDPSLTIGMPEAVTVDTGLDALCHAIEALFSTQRSLFSDLYARSALDRIINHLPIVKAEPANLESRAEMQLAATFAGMAIADTSTLIPHAMGYPVTVRYDLPHGRVTALLMPAFLEQLQGQEPERVAFVGRVLGQVEDGPAALRAFIERLGVAPRLAAYGFQEQDIDLFSRQALVSADLNRTPGQWLEETLREIYRRSL